MENKGALLEKIELCDLSIATHCNFKCKMCFFWKHNSFGSKTLDNKQWMGIIDQIGNLPNKDSKLIFSGPGEVLLRPGIEDLLKYAGSKFSIILNTNGYLIDQNMAKLLSETVDIISISLDGINPQTHDFLRGVEGSYEHVIKAIGFLRQESAEMIINIAAVIIRQNIDEILKLVRWVDEQPINGIIFQAVASPNTADYDKYWYKNEFKHLWPEDIEKVVRVIDKLIEMKKNGSKIVNSFNQLECFKNYFIDPESSIEKLHCEIDRALKIDASGDIKMCDFSVPVGNVSVTPLLQILTSSLAEQERAKAYQCKSPCHLLVNCFHDNKGE